MYLVDTNVISEVRKGSRANAGVIQFFRNAVAEDREVYLSAVTVGELRRSVTLIRHRGDIAQAKSLEAWLQIVLREYGSNILPIGAEIAEVWGRLRVPRPEHALDKLIAATALIHDLTVVSRNIDDFVGTGSRVLNPFS
ncbi:type II toxin-antitoxin system VapC family toxin [Bordetella genomosp. 9]|uniref:Ribonuclease VapC n=1 Tax=Bordetella genomosp. 9 TaxID=1416803 RepID=A0A1W6YW53_9BORD|nr:type II toxin-antitoxin system VapC family toxin [Bordetella genomosp. 9]ARP85310.1 VapC toxin family PIN domain ribonuclease [Bordetella genomosp. 9]